MRPFIVEAMLQQQKAVSSLAGRLRKTWDMIDSRGVADLFRSDMISLAAATMQFKPDIVLELGRGWGASTATFRLTNTPVVSICRSTEWSEKTVPMLSEELDVDFSESVSALVGEIESFDYDQLLAGKARALIFWDAHGLSVAKVVLSRILPALAGKETLVVCHDMRDKRYFEDDVSQFIRYGDVYSSFEQVIPIVKFTHKNGIDLRSPSHDLASDPVARSLWPDEWWPAVLWYYFQVPRTLRIPH